MELTEEQAQNYYARLHATGELRDNELGDVAGGCETVEFKCPECGSFKIDHFRLWEAFTAAHARTVAMSGYAETVSRIVTA